MWRDIKDLVNILPYIVVIQYVNSFELLGNAKALIPNNIRSRKTEINLEIIYAEIKALYKLVYYIKCYG